LLGSVVFDLRELWAAAGALRYFFPSHFYLEAVMEASAAPVLALWGMTLAAVVCLEIRRKV